ncbi:ABC transporter ATP-binding protein [Sphingobium sp. BYY-5]|uniref:ABC transporter ATP-binding protein n=1 Tax=Sphingobium sp. BYY-5 TaxID=2926400 RepID=UPI001FA7A75C|nr:ABC transporter ATP-binding protein [Sphingobium sp. BYY-5]MCI4592523.1 ABC transporter ATP-binding protein [Sphingobium sp. BYY-5]
MFHQDDDPFGRQAPVLSLTGVHKRFGDKVALDGIDLSIAPGEVFALLGPNGAGKTTTINLILGFLGADEGMVQVAGVDAGADPIAARRHVAYIPEQVALYPAMSGIENLRYFTTLAGLALDHKRCAALLDDAGLAAEAQLRKAGSYSKGMRQKVGIAIAVARAARLLLLDEPTSGLDPAASAEFSRIVRNTAAQGTAVMMATHDLYRLNEVADRVGILHHGRIAEEVDPKRLDHVDLEQLYMERLAV